MCLFTHLLSAHTPARRSNRLAHLISRKMARQVNEAREGGWNWTEVQDHFGMSDGDTRRAIKAGLIA